MSVKNCPTCRRYNRQAKELREQVRQHRQWIVRLAMLAADTPQFDNPLVAFEVKKYRDDVLRSVERKP